MKFIIYWTKEGLKIKDKICKYFEISNYMSVNGETPIDISEDKINNLKKTEQRKLIQIRNKNGGENI